MHPLILFVLLLAGCALIVRTALYQMRVSREKIEAAMRARDEAWCDSYFAQVRADRARRDQKTGRFVARNSNQN